MRVFLAGASGVIGRRLVPLLVDAGHHVVGLTRSAEGGELIRSLGAEPVVGDVFASDGLKAAVTASGAELVMHQLTDLPDEPTRIGEFAAANARIRREGTRNLLDAARAAGSRHLVAQSVAWRLPGDAGAAVDEMERLVLDAGGVVLRYGQFYGPARITRTNLRMVPASTSRMLRPEPLTSWPQPMLIDAPRRPHHRPGVTSRLTVGGWDSSVQPPIPRRCSDRVLEIEEHNDDRSGLRIGAGA